MPKPASIVPVLSEEKQAFLLKNLSEGVSPTIISRAFLRRFGTPCAPSLIESLRPNLIAQKVNKSRDSVEDIKAKLPTHDAELEYVRKKILDRMEDDAVPNNQFVNLAREYRSNIQASHGIASMTDVSDGKTQFVLFYGDTAISSSPDADIEDAEFKLHEEDDD